MVKHLGGREAVFGLLTIEQAWKFWTHIRGCEHGEGCRMCCWEWQGKRDGWGYGCFTYGARPTGKRELHASRLAYIFLYGDIPAGCFVCHTCDNPPCCNPQHLWVGTTTDNIRDAVRKGRMATGEQHGSQTSPDRVARGNRHGTYTHPESIPRGEQRVNAKLTTPQVKEIRALAGSASRKSLARTFGVDKKTILDILRGKLWTHLLPQPEAPPHGTGSDNEG